VGYLASIDFVKSVFTEAIEVNTVASVDMAGTYLLIDNVEKHNDVQDKITFVLVVASNTLTGKTGVMDKLEDYRTRILNNRFNVNFDFIKRIEMQNGTLFSVAFGFSMLTNLT
jgi:hypothetical protein